MINKIIKRTIAALNQQQKIKLLSKDFVLADKTSKSDVLAFIKKLTPQNVGIDLIRMGSHKDGGYLVPNDIEGIKACFSPGVNTVSEFEMDCHKRNMKIFLADKSVDKPRLNLKESEYHFLKKFVGCLNDDDFITLDDWATMMNVESGEELMLQMDIEGAEYVTLINTSEALLKSYRIVILEIHGLHKLWNQEFYKLASAAFDKLLQHHTCVHIHPNNHGTIIEYEGIEIPSVLEMTFIRTDRIKDKSPQKEFPHPLDSHNSKNRVPMVLPEIWYKD